MLCLRQEELLHLSIHNLTWQESNIGRIMNHKIWKRATGLLRDWEWLQNFSTYLATFLDLKKAVPDLFFFHLIV